MKIYCRLFLCYRFSDIVTGKKIWSRLLQIAHPVLKTFCYHEQNFKSKYSMYTALVLKSIFTAKKMHRKYTQLHPCIFLCTTLIALLHCTPPHTHCTPLYHTHTPHYYTVPHLHHYTVPHTTATQSRTSDA